MGGELRSGETLPDGRTPDEIRALLDDHPRFHVLNVSLGQGERGFDIGRHDYWFRHPWVVSDVLLAVRGRLPPDRRGLEHAPAHGVWYLSPDYPERVRDVALREIGPRWAAQSSASIPRGR